MLAVYFSSLNLEAWNEYKQTICLLVKSPYQTSCINARDGLRRTALHWAAIQARRNGFY